MKTKTVAILLIVSCILAAAVWFTTQSKKPEGQSGEMGAELFTGLSAREIESVTITGPEAVSNLKETPDGWIVENRMGYPADFSKIAELVQKLTVAKVGRSFPSSTEIQSRQALYPPEDPQAPRDKKGTRIVLANKDAKALADLIIGKPSTSATGSDAYYVLRPSDGRVYLIDQNFRFLDKKPAGWLDAKPIDLNPKRIRKVVCIDPRRDQPLYLLERPTQDEDPVLSELPAGKKMAKFKADQVFEALTSFTVEDVADSGHKDPDPRFAGMPHFEYHLYDGTVYHAFPGAALNDGSDKHYFRAQVSFSPPAQEAALTEGQDAAAQEAEKQNNRISPWTFVISKWVFDSFATDPDQFLEKEEKP